MLAGNIRVKIEDAPRRGRKNSWIMAGYGYCTKQEDKFARVSK